MTAANFYKLLRTFLLEANLVGNEVILTEFKIEMQPGLVSFGGQMYLADGSEIPMDLRQIGKQKCWEMTEQIEPFHRMTTDEGRNKWNKAVILIKKSGDIETQFLWDEEFEQGNINTYGNSKELVRQKWYWEENN